MPGRVLLVPLDFASWRTARSWSYIGALGFADGMARLGVTCDVLPALAEFPSQSPLSWLAHAPSLLAGRTYDQAWVWCTHNHYDASFLDWLATVAPVRVGLVMESMDYTASEHERFPHLRARRAFVEAQLMAMTHVLAFDEHDAASFASRINRPSLWAPSAVPEEMIATAPHVLPDAAAAFFGELYGDERATLLGSPCLRGLLERFELPDTARTGRPRSIEPRRQRSQDWRPDGHPSNCCRRMSRAC